MPGAEHYIRICMNDERKLSEQEVELPQGDSYWYSPFCESCHTKGQIKVRHRGREFPSPEAFDEHAIGLIKEFRLLKRIIDAGIGTEEDKKNITKRVVS